MSDPIEYVNGPADDDDIDVEMVKEEIRGARLEIQQRIEALRAYGDLDIVQEAILDLGTCDDWLAELIEEPYRGEEESAPFTPHTVEVEPA